MKKFSSVEEYIESNHSHKEQLNTLREILLQHPLDETIKWGAPAYQHNGKTIIGLASFKNYTGLWFHQGVFLKDPHKVLINAQEGVTKALRQWRFSAEDQINKNWVDAYVAEAIENCKNKKELKPQRNKPVVLPALLKETFQKNAKLSEQFELLTKSKQREYCEYIDQAKREETKTRRLEKAIPLILQGVGLNDKYK